MSRAWLAITRTLAVLAVPLAAQAQQPGTLSLIHSEWGTLVCSSSPCAKTLPTGFEVYWLAPILAVTRNHVPILTRTCDAEPGRAQSWDCRSGRPTGPTPAGNLDRLWESVPMWDDEGSARVSPLPGHRMPDARVYRTQS